MAEFVHRGDARIAAKQVVSVAELLRRNIPAQRAATGADAAAEPTAPAHDPAPEVPTEPVVYVSVGSLLRREGRAPHALDRPVRPRASRVPAVEDVEAPETRRPSARSGAARRMTVAAGAMLAVGGVLGAAILTDAASNSSAAQEGLDGSYPGRALDGTAGSTTALQGPGSTAANRALDGGTAAPASWMNVAFPSALAPTAPASPAGPGSAPGATPGNGPAGYAPAAQPAGAFPAGPAAATPPAGGLLSPITTPLISLLGGAPADSGNAPGNSSGRHAAAPRATVGDVAAGTTQTVGNVARTAGDVLPVAKPLTDALAGGVEGAGNGLRTTTDSTVGLVTKLAEPVSKPVTQIVTGALPATKPVLDLVAPADPTPTGQTPEAVVTTVGKGVGGVTQGLGQTVNGLVGGLGGR